MTMAEADLPPENAIAVEVPKATRYSPVRISPSAIVKVTGPCPTPVLTKDALSGPRPLAAAFMGKVSAVSVQPLNITNTTTSRAGGISCETLPKTLHFHTCFLSDDDILFTKRLPPVSALDPPPRMPWWRPRAPRHFGGGQNGWRLPATTTQRSRLGQPLYPRDYSTQCHLIRCLAA
jgi:hypothetical protein